MNKYLLSAHLYAITFCLCDEVRCFTHICSPPLTAECQSDVDFAGFSLAVEGICKHSSAAVLKYAGEGLI